MRRDVAKMKLAGVAAFMTLVGTSPLLKHPNAFQLAAENLEALLVNQSSDIANPDEFWTTLGMCAFVLRDEARLSRTDSACADLLEEYSDTVLSCRVSLFPNKTVVLNAL